MTDEQPKIKCHWCNRDAVRKDYREIDETITKIPSCEKCFGLSTAYLLQRDHAKEMKKKNSKYEKAYHILMEYWDSLPDEEKPKIDERLKKIGV